MFFPSTACVIQNKIRATNAWGFPLQGQTAYLGFIKELRQAHPDCGDAIAAINVHVSAGALYKALKEIRKLIKREAALLAA